MNTTSTEIETIDRPVQRAILYARWWQAGPIPPPLFNGNPRVAMYIRVGSVKQLQLVRGEAECGTQRDMASYAYTGDEGWDIVGAFKDVGTVDKVWDRPAFRQVMDIMRAGQATVLVVSHLDRFARRADHRRYCQRAGGSWAMTVALDQERLPDDEPRPAFHLLARPHLAGIPPPTDGGLGSTR